MNTQDKKIILKRFQTLLHQHGVHPKSLGWNNNRHYLRYALLLSQWDVRGASILDFGCGFGDMYGFLQKLGFKTRYYGVDIHPDLVREGRKKYPDAHLSVRDIFKAPPRRKFDYIFSSGTHNTKVRNNQKFIADTFKIFNQYATKGFALNFMSDKVDYRHMHAFYASPSKILDLAYRYSRRVVLRNDYMPFEFTIFVDKRDRFDSQKVVYPDFKLLVPDFLL